MRGIKEHLVRLEFESICESQLLGHTKTKPNKRTQNFALEVLPWESTVLDCQRVGNILNLLA